MKLNNDLYKISVGYTAAPAAAAGAISAQEISRSEQLILLPMSDLQQATV